MFAWWKKFYFHPSYSVCIHCYTTTCTCTLLSLVHSLSLSLFLNIHPDLISELLISEPSQGADGICVTWIFLFSTVNVSCLVILQGTDGHIHHSEVEKREGTNIGAKCITHLPSGNYMVTVHEGSCRGTSFLGPVFANHSISITNTSVTTGNALLIGGSVLFGFLLITALVITVIVLCRYVVLRKQQKKVTTGTCVF